MAATPTDAASRVPPFVLDNCLYLDALTPCGNDYYGYPVALNYGGTFSDYGGFVQLMNNLSDPTITAASLSQYYGCQQGITLDSLVQQMRYQLSFFCAQYVYRSIADGKCGAPTSSVPAGGGPAAFQPLGLPVCSAQCTFAEQSLTTIISNATLCPNAAAAADKIQRTKTFCLEEASIVRNSGASATCLAAVAAESAACGFRSSALAASGCPTLTGSDSCCASLMAASGSSVVNNATGGPGTYSSGVSVVGIAIGSVSAGLVIGAIVFAVVMVVRRRKRETQYQEDSIGKHVVGSGGAQYSGDQQPGQYAQYGQYPQNLQPEQLQQQQMLQQQQLQLQQQYYAQQPYLEHPFGQGQLSPQLQAQAGRPIALESGSEASSAAPYRAADPVTPPAPSATRGFGQNAPLPPLPSPFPQPTTQQPTQPQQQHQSLYSDHHQSAASLSLTAPSAHASTVYSSPLSPRDTVSTANAAAVAAAVAAVAFGTGATAGAEASKSSAKEEVGEGGGGGEGEGGDAPTLLGLPEGTELRVIFPYAAALPDELTLTSGSVIRLLRSFDDGWALGLDPATGRQGAFPVVCVAPVDELDSGTDGSRPASLSVSSQSAPRRSMGELSSGDEMRFSKRTSSFLGSVGGSEGL